MTPDPGYQPTLPRLLATSVERYPDRDYVVGNDSRLTFTQADERSRDLAAHLVGLGAGKGSRIGVLLANSPEWVVAFLAAARLGALVVPLSTFYTPAELRSAIRQADVQLLLTRGKIAGRSSDAAVADLVGNTVPGERIVDLEVPSLRHVLRLEELQEPAPAGLRDLVDALGEIVAPSDPLSVILTSGTSGRQKAVVHTHGALVRHSYGLAVFQRIPDGRSTYTGAPFFWVGGLVPGVLVHLHIGGRLITQERLDPDEMVDLIQAERPDVLFGFNLLERLKRSAKYPAQDPDWLPEVGAAHRSPELAAKYHNSLGMSETAGAHSGPGDEAARELPPELLGSFGKPLPGIEHRIVAPCTTMELPEGETGEICVRGYSLMDGLYGRERSEVFDADGWYHTGDLGFFRDGYLFFVGRSGDMIKTKGANVSPEEVRLALLDDAEVEDAAVLGVPDPEAGELVVAVVVTRNLAAFDRDRTLMQLQKRISAYKVPKNVVAVSALPLLAAGKPDRVLMRRWFTEPASRPAEAR